MPMTSLQTLFNLRIPKKEIVMLFLKYININTFSIELIGLAFLLVFVCLLCNNGHHLIH